MKKEDIEITIGEHERSKDEKIVVRARRFKGRWYGDLRLWYRGDDGWHPTAKGISLRPSEIVAASCALDKAMTAIADRDGGDR